jgi:hypothetical protein
MTLVGLLHKNHNLMRTTTADADPRRETRCGRARSFFALLLSQGHNPGFDVNLIGCCYISSGFSASRGCVACKMAVKPIPGG